MSWFEDLPSFIARRQAWQAEHGPSLAARVEQNRRDRAHVADLIARGLTAINATAADRALVFDKTGFGQ